MDFTKKNGALVPKQRLFAPMLASFGGGSARGFNPGGPDSGSGYYFGAEYSGWTGSDIIFNNATYDEYNGSGTTTYDSLDTFIDNANNRIYGGYNTVHYLSWTNGGSTYASNASFYSVNPSTDLSDLSGFATSGMGSEGRGVTVAYLSDASRTAVLVVGHSNSATGKGAYFYRMSDGAYLGKADFTNSSGTASNADDAGLCWDGEYLLRINRSDSAIYAYEMPSSSSISGSLSLIYQWTTPSAVQYGMVFCGYNSNGQRRVIYSDNAYTSGCREVLLDVPTAPNQYSLGHTVVGSTGKYDLGATNYSLALDYKNTRLIVGGYSNHKYRVFGT